MTPQMIEEFQRDGVARLGRVLSDETVQAINTRFKELFDAKTGTADQGLRNITAASNSAEDQTALGNRHFQLMNPWHMDPVFRDLYQNDAIVKAHHAILGDKVQLIHDQIFFKPAGDGARSQWHLDNNYFQCDPPDNALTIWIALDDADQENSCLWYMPGSHKLPAGESKIVDTGSTKLIHLKEVDESKLVPYAIKAGHALMHHSLVVHGAYPNHSDLCRRSYGIHCVKTGTPKLDGGGFNNFEACPTLDGTPLHKD